MRRCPKCDERLLRRRYVSASGISETEATGAVEIDVCGGCRGVWLDWSEVGELKELRAFITAAHGASWQRDLQEGRCPGCDKTLDRLPIGAFAVDRCAECEGLWFDGGELGAVLTEQGFNSLMTTLRRYF